MDCMCGMLVSAGVSGLAVCWGVTPWILYGQLGVGGTSVRGCAPLNLSILSMKKHRSVVYVKLMGWIGYGLAFALVGSAIMCLITNALDTPVNVQIAEA